MRTTIYRRSHLVGDDYYWKILCVVYDNDSLDLLLTLLGERGIEYKTETFEGDEELLWGENGRN